MTLVDYYEREEDQIQSILLAQRRHKARVSHLCVDCGEVIRPGEIYTRSIWLVDGDFFAAASCTSTQYGCCDD